MPAATKQRLTLNVELNPGGQHDFVTGTETFSSYTGGVGSGKTFAGIARGLMFSDQPVTREAKGQPPRGLIGSRYYPELRDVILPQLFKIAGEPGMKGSNIAEFRRQEMKIILTNGAEILLRSLDQPDRLRGIEISWAYFDEGRNLGEYAWDVILGRLRQPGYRHGAWVCSTPNGYDWMYKLFHPDSGHRIPGSEIYFAASQDNVHNIGQQYIDNLEAKYGKDSPFYLQEVMGEFHGVTAGAVFSEWKPNLYVKPVPYDPTLPLYAGWDWGIGDLGTCIFLQVHHHETEVTSGNKVLVPHVNVVDHIAMADANVKEWANAFRAKCYTEFSGRVPDRMFGDPAGKARNMVSGTSVYSALRDEGIHVVAARKQPHDLGLNIIKSLMNGGRLLMDESRCGDVSKALMSCKWNIDETSGVRLSDKPVHDWTSHYVDALRYVLSQVVGLREFKRPKGEKRLPPRKGTLAHYFGELNAPQDDSVWVR